MNEKFDEVLEEMRSYIEGYISAGFLPAHEIVDAGIDMVSDQADPERLRPIAERMTNEALQRHLEKQKKWPAITDCDRLDAAFDELENRGIVSRQDFSCCQNCGSYEIGDEIQAAEDEGRSVRGYTFYHMQDTESAVEGYGICLAYGSTELNEESHKKIGHEIISILEKHGLNPEWNGDLRLRIAVPMDWKRRR